MTAETMNTVGIVLLASSSFFIVFARVFLDGSGGWITKARHAKVIQRVFPQANGQSWRVDWMRYRTVPKERIVALANRHGWHHVGDEIEGRSWWLLFDKNPHSAVREAQRNDPHRRLAAELAAAVPDAKGHYVLDTAPYGDLGDATLERAVAQTGWESRPGLGSNLVLSRRGTTTAEYKHGPFLEGESPQTLCTDPAVVERAREIEQTKGFDPLSGYALNRARERNAFWAKKFYRQVGLAFLYGFLGPFLLAVTIAGDLPDGEPTWIAATITAIVLLLFAIAFVKAWGIRRRRAAEIGAFITAYQELNKIYRTRT